MSTIEAILRLDEYFRQDCGVSSSETIQEAYKKLRMELLDACLMLRHEVYAFHDDDQIKIGGESFG